MLQRVVQLLEAGGSVFVPTRLSSTAGRKTIVGIAPLASVMTHAPNYIIDAVF